MLVTSPPRASISNIFTWAQATRQPEGYSRAWEALSREAFDVPYMLRRCLSVAAQVGSNVLCASEVSHLKNTFGKRNELRQPVSADTIDERDSLNFPPTRR